ncbi:MAG: translation initiation factor IF-3 [Richelia sp. RM2_1_2]|nr:translation initiation factor IF-3 [Richelia sp. RM2_1_2]
MNKPSISDEYRVNGAIKGSEVRVVTDDGQQLGILTVKDAINVARQRGLDLVEIAPTASPPVCKILNYNKFKFDEKKKAKDIARKNRESKVEIKELWLRPVTERHDLEVKARHAREFLEDGDKVRFIVKFKGREISHAEHGRTLLESVLELVGEVKIDTPITQSGRQLSVVISAAPKK